MSMTDGAPAPGISVDISDVAAPPNPISTEPPPASAKGEVDLVKPTTPRDALLRAAEKVAKDNPDPDDKTAPVKTEAQQRDDKGKFAGSDRPDAKDAKGAEPDPKPVPAKTEPAKVDVAKAAPVPTEPAKAEPEAPKPTPSQFQAPQRFSEDAKKVWDTAPEPVRAEVARMERELTQGLEKYKGDADNFEHVREFHERAKQEGTDLKTVLGKYVGLEDVCRKDIVKGLEGVCQNLGISLRAVAAHIMGQTPEQQSVQTDTTISELKREIADLKDKVGGVTTNIEKQKENSTFAEIAAFAEKNPRFEELHEDISLFIKTGRAKDLSEAYALADRLNPSAAPVAKAAAAIEPEPAPDPKPVVAEVKSDPEAQTLKGSKSITGAPTSGSNPAKKPPASSIKESLRRAIAAAG